jgi:hypothetical protein
LPDHLDRLLWGALAIVIAIVLSRVLRSTATASATRRAIEEAARRSPAGEARFLRAPRVVEDVLTRYERRVFVR